MKHLKILFLLFVAAIFFACSKDSPDEIGSPEGPVPEDTHKVSPQSALSELNAVLSALEEGQTRSGGPRSVAGIAAVKAADVLPATRSAEVPDVEDLVYIANFEDGQGYAILAADDRLAPVIAITDQGSLTPEQFSSVARGNYDVSGNNPPPVFGDAVAYAMRIGLDIGPVKPPMGTTYGPWTVTSRIGPFMPMRWGQAAPYNKYAYDVYGQKCPAGCVAVAVSQIVASNRYRFERNGYPHWDYGDFMIDWRVIFKQFDSYGPSATIRTLGEFDTSPEGDMIAQFIRGIGDEVGTTYTTDGNSSNIGKAKKFLHDLGYGDVKTRDYSGTYVDRMVRERNMPIYVRGNCGGDGHAWIIDGILYQDRTVTPPFGSSLNSRKESRALFHCNFGWSGKCDGYYLMELFDNPKEGPAVMEPGDTEASSPYCFTTKKECITWTTAW